MLGSRTNLPLFTSLHFGKKSRQFFGTPSQPTTEFSLASPHFVDPHQLGEPLDRHLTAEASWAAIKSGRSLAVNVATNSQASQTAALSACLVT